MNILKNSPKINEYLSQESLNYFDNVKNLLDDYDIQYQEDPMLVRGLDYYSHTTFELQTMEDKRQNAILAGGRYDKLISMISSKDIPGVGWAAGIERLINLISEKVAIYSRNKVLFAVQEESYLNNNKVLKQLYSSEVNHEVRVSKNIKKLFSYADKNNFDFILLIGEKEMSLNKIILKDLKNKTQKSIEISIFNIDNEIR